MEDLNVKSIDSLRKGILRLLSQSRCSFSEEEKVLLFDCLQALERLKEILVQKNTLHLTTAIKVVELLMRVFAISGHMKEMIQ